MNVPQAISPLYYCPKINAKLENNAILWSMWIYQLLMFKKIYNCVPFYRSCDFFYATYARCICCTKLCIFLDSGLASRSIATIHEKPLLSKHPRTCEILSYKSITLQKTVALHLDNRSPACVPCSYADTYQTCNKKFLSLPDKNR